MIQTETGAREGVIRAEQIENLSIISRSPMELLRILPGVVTTQDSLESVSNGGGANQTQRLQRQRHPRQQQRGHPRRLPPDRHRLEQRPDHRPEHRLRGRGQGPVRATTRPSSAPAASRSAPSPRAAAPSSTARSTPTCAHHQFAANDRSNSIAGVDEAREQVPVPRRQPQRPHPDPGHGLQQEPRQGVLLPGRRAVAAERGHRVRLRGGADGEPAARPLHRLPERAEPEPAGEREHPERLPGRGQPAPGNNLAPYIDPMGQKLINLYPQPNYNDPNNRYNYVFNALQKQDTTQVTLRVDYNFTDSTKAYVRLAQDDGQVDQARGLWWASSNYELPTRVQQPAARSHRVAEPHQRALAHHHQRVHLQLEQAQARQRPRRTRTRSRWRDSASPATRASSARSPRSRRCSIYSWGQGLGNLWDPSDQHNIFAYNSSLQIADNFTKVLNTHAVKIGVSVERQYKFQNFQNSAHTAIIAGRGLDPRHHRQRLRRPAGRPSGRRSSRARRSTPATGSPGTSTATSRTPGRSRRTSRWSTASASASGRTTRSRTRLGAVFIPERYDRNAGTFLDAAKTRVNGVAYASTGEVPKSLIDQPQRVPHAARQLRLGHQRQRRHRHPRRRRPLLQPPDGQRRVRHPPHPAQRLRHEHRRQRRRGPRPGRAHLQHGAAWSIRSAASAASASTPSTRTRSTTRAR